VVASKKDHDHPAIDTTALTRRFGDFTAVDNVNLRVEAGQFFDFSAPTERANPPPSRC